MNVETIARVVALGVVLLNMILSAFHINPIPCSQDEVYIIVSTLLTCLVAVFTTWKNNSITEGAKAGDKVMIAIKNSETTIEAVEEFLQKTKEVLEDGGDE